MSDMVYSACYDAGRTSTIENDEQFADDEDAIAWLCESRCTAPVLADLARIYGVEPPGLVKRALERMEAESQAA